MPVTITQENLVPLIRDVINSPSTYEQMLDHADHDLPSWLASKTAELSKGSAQVTAAFVQSNHRAQDFTPKGLRREGPYENDRNADSQKLFEDILAEVYGATKSIIGHHMVYVVEENDDGFNYQITQEVPSADALLFDPEILEKLFGEENWKAIAHRLAIEPIATRDALMAKFYYGRDSDDESSRILL
jgi:hypothetical protein